MSDEDYKDLVNKHDKSIGIMASSIEHLASAVGATNSKLSDIVEVMGKQNILMEKFSNLEVNLKESFDRVHSRSAVDETRIKDLEHNVTKLPSPAVVKWGIGIIIVYLISFGTYVVDELHTIDTSTSNHSIESKSKHEVYDERIERNTNNINRNYGQIQGYFSKHKD